MCKSERSCVIGVLALQGAFEEHQHCLEQVGCKTVQVRDCIDRRLAADSLIIYLVLL